MKSAHRIFAWTLLLAGPLRFAAAADEVRLPAPPPTVTALMPAGVARGGSVEITVQGANLVPTSAVRVVCPGVSAEIVPPAAGANPNSRRVTVRLTAAADAQLGLGELRLVTPAGASNVARFAVGALSEATEREPNETAAQAMPLASLPLVVNGAINRGEDRDFFRFSAKSGQVIVLDLCGQRLHPYVSRQRPGWFEGLLTIREATALGRAADEALVAERTAAARAASSKQAAAALAARRAEAKRATDAKVAADKPAAAQVVAAKNAASQLAQATAAAEKAVAGRAAAERDVAAKVAAVAAANKQLAAQRTAADKAIAARNGANQDVNAKAQTARVATEKSSAFIAAAFILSFDAERIAAEKVAAEKSANAARAARVAETAKAAAKAAAIEDADVKKAAAATAVAAAEKAAAEKAVADRAVHELTAAVQATARKVAAAAAVEKNAVDAKNGASQIAVAKATAAKAATDLANAAQAAVGKANAAKSAAENSLVQQTAAAKTAQTKAAQAKAALDKATAAKIAAEKVVAGKATALVAANARVTAAAAAANQATAELAAANKRVVEQNASRDKIADQPFRNLAYAHDYGGREDPLLVFTAPRDGQYIVEVRDELYRGRAEFNYRLTIGQLPFVTSAFPAGGKRGATIPVKLRGINLTKTEFALDFAADTPVGGPRWRRAADTANDLAFAVGEDPEVIEVEPNDGAEQATATQVPATANGVIEQPGDVDYFKFNAAKGQRLFFETVSRSLGSPLDARLDLFDANGRRLKNNDDANSSPDSSIDHTFAADGEYTIRVGDTTGQGSSRHVYRLDVHPPRPDFALTVSPDNPRVTAGGATPLKVLVQRRQGFTGPIELTVANPPPGAIVSPTVMASNQTEQTVSITMPPDAAPGVVAISVVGKAKIGEQEVTRKARPSEQIRYVNAWRYVPVDDLLLTVMPQAPVVLMWAAPELKVTSGKTVEIPIKIQRTAGFTAPIRVVLQGLPSRVAAPPVTVAENASEAIVEIRTYNGAPVNLANVVANGSVSFQGRSYVQSSPALRLRVEAVKKEEPAKKK